MAGPALARGGGRDIGRRCFSLVRSPRVELIEVASLAARAYLVVGTFFAVATRAGWSVAGIGEPIVELTAVHFHYAAFATLVIGTCVARSNVAPRLTAVLLVIGLCAPPAVAAGFTWSLEACQIGGAVLLTAEVWMIAGVTLARVGRRAEPRARPFLVVSSLAVLAPMVLAVFWATAQYENVPALSIDAMARVHGTLNAFGFVGCGLLGWRLARQGAPDRLTG